MNILNILIMILIIGLSLFLIFLMHVVIRHIINACCNNWIDKRCNTIGREFERHGYYLSSESYNYFGLECYGYSIRNNETKERTDTLSYYELQRLVFKLYEKNIHDVLEPMIAKHEEKNNKLKLKYNKGFFSSNKYKCAVSFKSEDE